MGLFDKALGMITGQGSSAPSFDPEVARLNAGMMNNLRGDVGGVRTMANTNITGLNASGHAMQGLATDAYNDQRQGLFGQQQGAMASAQAGMARHGMDSGSMERMQQTGLRSNLLGQQNLARGHQQNMSNIAAQNLGQQENNRVGALMALPAMQQGVVNTQFNADSSAADARNQASLANMRAKAARSAGIASTLGTMGSIAGGVFGGPIGAAAGGMAGNALGNAAAE